MIKFLLMNWRWGGRRGGGWSFVEIPADADDTTSYFVVAFNETVSHFVNVPPISQFHVYCRIKIGEQNHEQKSRVN